MSALRNTFVFGSDFGGNYYFYDVMNESGFGSYSVFQVYPGNPNWEDSIYIGNSLTELLEKIINGENFSEYPRLKFKRH
jgi:hypothetical protein